MSIVLWVLALACDAAVVAAGGYLLWATGGTTVAAGPPQTFVLVVVGTAVFVALRLALLARVPALWRALLWIADIILIAALFVGLQLTREYYLGWLAVYASLLIGCGAVLYLFTTAAGVVGDDPAPDGGLRAGTGLAALAAAIVGLFVTVPIHEWDPFIVSTIVATTATSVALGAAMYYLMLRVGARRARSAPETATAPEVPAQRNRDRSQDARENAAPAS